jgi:Ca2+-binding EF-hand superfamily protein
MRHWLFLLWIFSSRLAQGADTTAGQLLVMLPETIEVVRVEIPDYDFQQTRNRFADQLFQSRDTDKDGQLNAEEAPRLPVWNALTSQLQSLGAAWKQADLAPADGSLSSSEVRGLIDRGFGPPIRIQADRRGNDRAELLYSLIDHNRDGQLEPTELLQSAPQLRRCDFDDDEMLTLSELAELAAASTRPMDAKESTEPFLWCHNAQDRAAAAEQIVSRFHQGVPLGAVLGIDPSADSDGNQQLSAVEIVQALGKDLRGSALKIKVDGKSFGVRWLEPDDDPEVRTFRRSESVKRDGLSFKVNYRSSELLEQLRRQELNTQFGDADKDNNEYLSRGEYAELVSVAETSVPADPAVVDANGNQEITRDELLAAGELRAIASKCQLQLTVVREALTLFSMLDQDSNQGISSWEMQSSADRLDALDRNRDGRLAASELAGELALEVGFAGARQAETPRNVVRTRARPVARRTSTAGPPWFQRMDRNQDQRLSWREFLGTKEQFGELDADGDGAVSVGEAK